MKKRDEEEVSREKLKRLIEKKKTESTALKKILEAIEKENNKNKNK